MKCYRRKSKAPQGTKTSSFSNFLKSSPFFAMSTTSNHSGSKTNLIIKIHTKQKRRPNENEKTHLASKTPKETNFKSSSCFSTKKSKYLWRETTTMQGSAPVGFFCIFWRTFIRTACFPTQGLRLLITATMKSCIRECPGFRIQVFWLSR